jgi:hypothetical protein
MKGPKVTLYVKSDKRIVGTETMEAKTLISGGPGIRPGGYRMVPPRATYDFEEVPKYEFVLPEDQRDFVEMVKKVEGELGFAVKIIDVTKENIVRRELQKEIEKIRTFPTLTTDSGKRVEGKGNVSEEQVESFLLGK